MGDKIQKKSTTPVFFISTGRCATQFIAHNLSKHYADIASVEHEPLGEALNPRYYFQAYHRNENAVLSPEIRAYIKKIQETLEDRNYVEVGWPIYGLIPKLISIFDGKVKIVHLYRHPVRVAASLLTHNFYGRGTWSERMSLEPSDDGIAQNYLAGDRWRAMSEFEKTLFWWTEINNFALELKKTYSNTPWLSLKYEDLFGLNGDNELKKLIRFLEFPERNDFLKARSSKKDNFSFKASRPIDWVDPITFPQAEYVMKALGYTTESITVEDIRKRYEKTKFEAFISAIRDHFKRHLPTFFRVARRFMFRSR